VSLPFSICYKKQKAEREMTTFSLHQLDIHREEKIICKNLSLDFYAGNIIGILGQNGVGKTTLLQALCALYPWKSGQACINKENISTFARRELAQSVGLLLQQSQSYFPQTIKNYIEQGLFSKNTIWPWQLKDATQSILIEEAIHQFDLAHLLDKSITEISGGEQRRADLATLYIQNPKVYLLDEPFNHLDLKHQYTLKNTVKKWALDKKIIVLSTHDLETVSHLCTHILLMFNDGSHLFGEKEKVFTKDNVERLFECACFKTP
jgi:iron complex transport system ATP-binding protein